MKQRVAAFLIAMVGLLAVGSGIASATPNTTVVSSTAIAAPITVQGDGCTFSPDSFFGANFRPACDAHDKCYSRGSGTPRLLCDQAFHSALTVACVSTFPGVHPMRVHCTQAAMGYFVAVRQYGRSHYEGYGDPA